MQADECTVANRRYANGLRRLGLDDSDVTVALCRCGCSRQKPFCDGMHKATNFRAESGRRDDAGP